MQTEDDDYANSHWRNSRVWKLR